MMEHPAAVVICGAVCAWQEGGGGGQWVIQDGTRTPCWRMAISEEGAGMMTAGFLSSDAWDTGAMEVWDDGSRLVVDGMMKCGSVM